MTLRQRMSAVIPVLLLTVVPAHAEPRGGGGWAPQSPYGRMYDPKTVQVVSGEITRIDRGAPLRGMNTGVHLVLKTDTNTLPIHLGPSWYIDNQELKLAVGNKVQVRGSRISFNGTQVIIAAEVVRGEDVLRLRDENGIPFWAGWRRRGE